MTQTDIDPRSSATVVITTVLQILNISMAVTGNSFVCLALYCNRRLRTIANLYVLSLAMGDIAVTILVFIFSFVASVWRKWPFGYNFCQFNGYATYLWEGVSIYTLAVTAIKRYFCVVKPKRYPTLFTRKKVILSIVSVFVLTVFIGLVATLALPINYRWDPHRLYCAHVDEIRSTSIRSSRLIWLTIIGFYAPLPMLVIVYFYANVFAAVRRHNNSVIPSLQGSRNSNAAERAEEIRTSRVLFTAVVGFCICWLPTIVNAVLAYVFKMPLPTFSITIYSISAFTSAWINPQIYGAMSRAMRREFIKLFQCFPTRQQRTNGDRQSSSCPQFGRQEHYILIINLKKSFD